MPVAHLADGDSCGHLKKHQCVVVAVSSAFEIARCAFLSAHWTVTEGAEALTSKRFVDASEFEFYSAALRVRSGKWTADELARYLADLGAYAPRTTMPSPALDGETIADVVKMLQALKNPE